MGSGKNMRRKTSLCCRYLQRLLNLFSINTTFFYIFCSPKLRISHKKIVYLHRIACQRCVVVLQGVTCVIRA